MFSLKSNGNRQAQTERALGFLLCLAGGAFLLLLATAPAVAWSWSYLGIAVSTALASFAVGLALGLFFGLPSLVPRSADPKGGTAFAESTSLEQIADWLVKIVVGITLTRFDDLAGRLENAAAQISGSMSCRPSGHPCPPPVAGTIMACFTVLGFLIAYLWMRRYFIGELARGREDAERKFIDNAVSNGDVQTDDVHALMRGLAKPSTTAGDEIKPGDAPDDPWKGQFGGSSSSGDLALKAEVDRLKSQPGLFGVTITLEADTAEASERMEGSIVTFYLHPTFKRNKRSIVFRNGKAVLELVSYGAFTVGALTAFGDKFELDLAGLPRAPQAFRDN